MTSTSRTINMIHLACVVLLYLEQLSLNLTQRCDNVSNVNLNVVTMSYDNDFVSLSRA